MPWLMFINPWLLLGTFLVAVPILIHLFTRRRHRRVVWAAMDFLIQADKQTRRRIRLENLLLLLLRCLIVLLLVLLVSRPWWQPGPAGGLGAGARLAMQAREHVVILDDSPSMGTSQGAMTTYNIAKIVLRDFLRELAGMTSSSHQQGVVPAALGAGDVLTLLVTSRPQEPVIDHQRLSASDVQSWLARVDELAPSDRPASFEEIFRQLHNRWKQDKESLPRRLYVLSDFRQGDWRLGSSTRESPLGVSLNDLAEQVEQIVFSIQGEDHPANLSLTELSFSEAQPAAGVEIRVQATVVNHGPTLVRDVPLSLTINDASPQRAVINQLAPGEHITLPFTVIFNQPQPYRIVAQLAPDLLASDNQRYLAAWVTPGVSILLVRGASMAPVSGFGSGGRPDTFFLERALQPKGPIASGNWVQTVTDTRLETLNLDSYQIIFLSNLHHLTQSQIQALENWTQAGGALVGFLGDQVDATLYNQWLFREGQGLLPGRLREARGITAGDHFWTIEVQQPAHPVLRVFSGTQNPFLNQVKIFRHWPMQGFESSGVSEAAGFSIQSAKDPLAEAAGTMPQVLLTVRDADRWPLLVEQRFGKGRTLWFTTSADTRWTNWPGDPSFVVMMLELVRELAKPRTEGMNLQIGDPIQYILDPGRFRLETQWTMPQGRQLRVPAVAAGENAQAMLVRHDANDELGFYDMTLTSLDGQRSVFPFAVNLPSQEGNLARVELAAWQQHLGDKLHIQTGSLQRSRSLATAGKTELWRPILLLLVLTLMAEQTLAWTIGRRR